jgi:hypothetical protein
VRAENYLMKDRVAQLLRELGGPNEEEAVSSLASLTEDCLGSSSRSIRARQTRAGERHSSISCGNPGTCWSCQCWQTLFATRATECGKRHWTASSAAIFAVAWERASTAAKVRGHPMKRPILILLLSALSCSCDSSPGMACAAIAQAGLDVSVINEQNGQGICDATVTAEDGTYREALPAFSCRFVGAYERSGTYVVRAERAGFVTREVTNVRVTMMTGDCPHVETVRVQIRLALQ